MMDDDDLVKNFFVILRNYLSLKGVSNILRSYGNKIFL